MKQIIVVALITIFVEVQSSVVHPRIFMPIGTSISIEEFAKQTTNSNTVIACDVAVLLTDSISSKITDQSKKIGTVIADNAQQASQKGLQLTKDLAIQSADKTKEAVQWTKDKAIAAKDAIVAQVKKLQQKDSASHVTIDDAKSDIGLDALEADSKVITEEEPILVATPVVSEVKHVEKITFATKWPRHGMNIVLTKLVLENGYPIVATGVMSEEAFNEYAKQYSIVSEAQKTTIEGAYSRVFECLSGACLVSDIIEHELFIKLINQLDIASYFNTTGNGSQRLIFITNDKSAAQLASRYGCVGIYFESVKQLCDDLKMLGLPAVDSSRYNF